VGVPSVCAEQAGTFEPVRRRASSLYVLGATNFQNDYFIDSCMDSDYFADAVRVSFNSMAGS
jgi:hypothetical protein